MRRAGLPRRPGSTTNKAPPPPDPTHRKPPMSTINVWLDSQPNDPSGYESAAQRLRNSVRSLADLQLSDVRVHTATIEKPGQTPDDVRQQCRAIMRVGRGNGLIPSAAKGHAAALLDEGVLDDLNFADDEHDTSQTRAEHERFWAAAGSLMDAANECEEEKLCEADWNDEVHSRVLRLALERDRSECAVWFRNITTAWIEDRSLLPAGLAVQAKKMVNFAVVLDTRSDEALAELVRAKLRYEELPAINHIPAGDVRLSPIAVSIATRRAAVEEDAVNARLAVWVSAHFRWLRRLCKGDCALPTLPLVIVQGHEWRLMFGELEDDLKIRLHRHLNLVTTRSLLGVYHVVASLKLLAEWAKDTYRPWFEKEVLSVR